MAKYRTLTPTAELSDGTILGNGILDSTDLNNKSLKKGRGNVIFKELTAVGQPLQGGKQEAFGYGTVITGL